MEFIKSFLRMKYIIRFLITYSYGNCSVAFQENEISFRLHYLDLEGSGNVICVIMLMNKSLLLFSLLLL